MDTLQMIAILVILILILMFVYYIFNKQKTLTTGIRDGHKYYAVDTSSMNLDQSKSVSQMAVSLWVYVSDWDYARSNSDDKIILYMGPSDTDTDPGLPDNRKLPSDDSTYIKEQIAEDILGKTNGTTQSTIILWLESNANTLKLGIAHNGLPIFTDLDDDYISIKNFPLQKWVSVTFSIYQNALDLYLNGKLIKSVINDNIDIVMSEDILVSLGNPFNVYTESDDETTISNITYGFKGYTSKLNYYNESLTPKQAYNIYKSGPGTSYLGDILGDRGININFMDGEKVTKTFSL